MNQADAVFAREWILFTITVVVTTASVAAIWTRLKAQVNGLGGRLRKVESCNDQLETTVERTSQDVAKLDNKINGINDRVDRTEESLQRLDSHVTEMRLEVLSHLGEIKQLIITKDAETRQVFSDKFTSIRERVARVEEKNGLPHRDD